MLAEGDALAPRLWLALPAGVPAWLGETVEPAWLGVAVGVRPVVTVCEGELLGGCPLRVCDAVAAAELDEEKLVEAENDCALAATASVVSAA